MVDVGDAPAAPGAVPRSGGAGLGHWSLLRLSRAHFVERERKPVGAIAGSPCDLPAQLANESFRADHVRIGSFVGAVVQVLMRSDLPAAEAFFRDHLRASPAVRNFGGQLGVQDGAGLGEGTALMDRKPFNFLSLSAARRGLRDK